LSYYNNGDIRWAGIFVDEPESEVFVSEFLAISSSSKPRQYAHAHNAPGPARCKDVRLVSIMPKNHDQALGFALLHLFSHQA